MSDTSHKRVLVVGADSAMVTLVVPRLQADGFSVQVTNSADTAQSTFARTKPDVVLLDIDATNASGWRLLERIRQCDSVPVLIMSERPSEDDIVTALERGADDYVTKPLPLEELLARIRVGIRRSRRTRQPGAAVLQVADLEFDIEQRRVRRSGRLVRLTPTEYALVGLFTRYPDRLLTARMLRESVWGGREVSSHLLQVYIARLRQKLEEDPAEPRVLLTEPGAGYLLATRRGRSCG